MKTERMKGAGAMRVLAVAMAVSVLGTGMCMAELKLNHHWESIPASTNEISAWMVKYNIDAEGQTALMESEWDETVLVDTALRLNRFDIFRWASIPGLARENRERVKAAVVAYRGFDGAPWMQIVDLARGFPASDQADLQKVVSELYARRFGQSPVCGEVMAKYVVGHGSVGRSSTAEEALRVLLAPEWPPDPRFDVPAEADVLGACKERIKALATVGARKTLRREGKSFVTKDGVNPMVEALKPVTDALNAPACEGLEAALRALGIAVADMDRKPLLEDWKPEWEKVLDGTYTGWERPGYFPKVAVILGVEAFNTFVDEYNSGKQ